MNDSNQPDSSTTAPAPAAAGSTEAQGTGGLSAWRVPAALLFAALALGLSAWQWHDSRGEIAALRQELAKKLSDTDAESKESRQIAEQVRETVADAQAKLGMLESRMEKR